MKNFPAYLLTLLLTVYIMVMYTTPVFFMIFIGLILICVFEFITVLYMRWGVKIALENPGKIVYSGDMIPITFHIQNRCVFPLTHLRIGILYKNKIGIGQNRQWICTYVDGNCDAHITVYVESRYCGLVQIHADKVWTGGYFHLFSFRKKCDYTMEIPVFPHLYLLNIEINSKIRDFIGESDVYSKHKSGDDPSEVFDVRSYRPGDRMQRIHWKLTARSDEFIVKEFSRPVAYPVVVFFNFSEAGDEEELLKSMSEVIEAGLAFSAALARCHCWHYAAWCKKDMSIVRYAVESQEDVNAYMGKLLYVKPHMPLTNPKNFYGQKYGADSFCTFLSINTNRSIEKDGELYEKKGLDRDTLSGKNFIL